MPQRALRNRSVRHGFEQIFGSASPLNPTVARSSWNSLGLPEPGSSLARCSRRDYHRRHLRARGVLRDPSCFAFWIWPRRRASPLVVLLGIASLICFAVALTRVDSAFAGRAYAGYGGMYIAASLVWLSATEGQRPTVTDLIGAALAIVGALVIIGFASRTNGLIRGATPLLEITSDDSPLDIVTGRLAKPAFISDNSSPTT
jgi:small multidrug resistance family-3 protein